MSLDVYLRIEGIQNLDQEEHIFIREDGQNKEITREQWDRRYPDREPLTIRFPDDTGYVYSDNITHNLGKMASEAGIYYALWEPEAKGWTKAGEIVEVLEKGLSDLRARPEHYEQFNAPNGWGTYEQFVPFVARYLEACKQYPSAEIDVFI